MTRLKDERGTIELMLVGVMVVLLAGAGFLYYKRRHDATTKTAAASQTTTKTTPSVTATDPTADWKTYTNQDLKLSFKYPADYGDVSVTTSAGTAGTALTGKFSSNTNLSFGTDSVNFSAGRSGGLFDVLGFTKSGTTYQFKRAGDGNVALDGVVKDVAGVDTTGVLIKPVYDPNISQYDFYQFSANSLGAIFNLAGPTYPGVAFLDLDTSKLPQADFEQILQTVKTL